MARSLASNALNEQRNSARAAGYDWGYSIRVGILGRFLDFPPVSHLWGRVAGKDRLDRSRGYSFGLEGQAYGASRMAS
jgi:hypothetical protein